MRRLAITGFCAIALLSGCSSRDVRPRVVRGPPDISLPCNGDKVDTGEWKLTANNQPQTVVFHTDGRCDLSGLKFNTPDPQFPPGFKDRKVAHDDKSISYTYDGRQILAPYYTFYYENDYPKDGNGIGIIK